MLPVAMVGYVSSPRARATRRALALAGGALALASCSRVAGPLAASRILVADPARRGVELRLLAGETGADAGFNFDGYAQGRLTVVVPVGWRVDVACVNRSTVLTHSCAVVEDRPLSPYGAPPAFPGASVPDARHGLGFGQTAHFSFVAGRPGRYRIADLVVGHELDGSWDWLVVRRGVRPGVES